MTIKLPNNGRGFGFSVISDGDKGAIVHSILEGGIADKVRGVVSVAMGLCTCYHGVHFVVFLGQPIEQGRLAPPDQ